MKCPAQVFSFCGWNERIQVTEWLPRSLSGLWQSHRWEACFPFFYISRLWKFASPNPGLSPWLHAAAARSAWGRARTLGQSNSGWWSSPQWGLTTQTEVHQFLASGFLLLAVCLSSSLAFFVSLSGRAFAGRERKWNCTRAQSTRWIWHLWFGTALCYFAFLLSSVFPGAFGQYQF